MIVQASALKLPLADASVHCVVTSPPYWGLRAYDGKHQTQTWPDGWRGQLGAEPTPAMYLEHMVAVFAEIRRVLRSDGTLWLNMGDSYATGADHDQTFTAPAAVGWRPSCSCAAGDPVPALVLDPFGGTGTTAEVAYRLGRVGLSLDVAYQHLQRDRLGLFAGAAHA